MRIALVAGEPSGDYLGGGLIQALQARYPNARFEGIGGRHMTAAGLQSLYPLESLSVMGVVEIIRHLPRLLAIRRALRQRWRADPPDLFVGVDAPDFNLGLARRLRDRGLPTVQYVSPTVWAWREGRLKGIRESVDHVLCIYPFEADFYAERGMAATFVGHPLADQIPLARDAGAARAALAIPEQSPCLALLPGSRRSEIDRLLPLFLAVARQLLAAHPGLRVVIPAATPALSPVIERAVAEAGLAGHCLTTEGGAQTALAAADAAVVASGTATLEAMLVGCPAVMAYRVNRLTALLARRSVRIPYFAMPNLMAGEMLMPEFVQEQATPEAITPAVACLLTDPERAGGLTERFASLHQTLRRDAGQQAAAVVATLLEGRGG
jgi:lipid-A-disaccharide synthase